MLKNKKNIFQEIKDYFNNLKDEDYMVFDDHPLSSIDNLLDPMRPAPWDHLSNDPDDGDLDVDIREDIKK